MDALLRLKLYLSHYQYNHRSSGVIGDTQDEWKYVESYENTVIHAHCCTLVKIKLQIGAGSTHLETCRNTIGKAVYG